MAAALASFFLSIVLIFIIPSVGILALLLTFIWVVIVFCVTIMGWRFRGSGKEPED
jgi:hypothetical protein